MKEKINRDMLRYHAGRQMFCPHCDEVLDVRRAVSLDILRNGELARTAIMCARCYDARKERLETVAAGMGLTVEALDGRELFRTTRRRAKSAA